MIIDIPEEVLAASLTEIQDAIREGDGAEAQLKVAALATTLEEHSQGGTSKSVVGMCREEGMAMDLAERDRQEDRPFLS